MGKEEEVASQAVRPTSGTVNLIWPPVINYTSGWVMVTSFHAVVVSQGSLGLGAGWEGWGGEIGKWSVKAHESNFLFCYRVPSCVFHLRAVCFF